MYEPSHTLTFIHLATGGQRQELSHSQGHFGALIAESRRYFLKTSARLSGLKVGCTACNRLIRLMDTHGEKRGNVSHIYSGGTLYSANAHVYSCGHANSLMYTYPSSYLHNRVKGDVSAKTCHNKKI